MVCSAGGDSVEIKGCLSDKIGFNNIRFNLKKKSTPTFKELSAAIIKAGYKQQGKPTKEKKKISTYFLSNGGKRGIILEFKGIICIGIWVYGS